MKLGGRSQWCNSISYRQHLTERGGAEESDICYTTLASLEMEDKGKKVSSVVFETWKTPILKDYNSLVAPYYKFCQF